MATGTVQRHCLTFGDFTIDPADERVIGRDGPVKLGNKAYRVLLALATQKGRLLTKDDLFSSVWDGTVVSESALTSVIKELRRALGDDTRMPRYIECVYGRGYRLLPEVRHDQREAQPAPSEAASASPQPRGAGAARPPLLAIPAFDDDALRDAAPHLGAVLREEILLALSRFRDIRLVSDVGEAGAAGGGYGERDYQLTLKLMPGAPSIRAFARLSNLASRTIIWADSIDLADGTLGPNVDALVRRIAAAALPRLHDDLLSRPPAQPRDVYDLYFLTRIRMRAMASFAEAQAVAAAWERLIEEHPGFAPAYPPLTRLYNTDFCYTGLGSTGEEERRRAYELAHRAFAIDPTEAHLQTVKGWAHLWVGEAALARQHLREALRLNPYNQSRLIEVATALMYLDDLDGAAELLGRCRNLTPFTTDAPNEEQGLLHLLRGEFEHAADHLALVRRHHPDDPVGIRPTIKSELYSLLAAAGRDSSDLAERARVWRDSMAERWCGTAAPDADALKQWALRHCPFQQADRRDWIAALLERALAATDRERLRDPAPASRRTPS